MLVPTGNLKIYFCSRPTDMRMGFCGLSGQVRSFMQGNPLSGNLFALRNRRGDRLKILAWDGDGFVLWYKLLSKGTFKFPPHVVGNSIEIDHPTLMMILDGIDVRHVRRQKRFKMSSLI
ncbi:MAG: IS66 family insertion sequence element accessory protein TnpB [Candidatus Obscuribacter phosphatis]|uniref:IS66 family insertion sequence element accessory protein TnpB n=1 Tax=Candidatus Obscuribacter phosphatis TaxID=1906157 RepID=A0A8J7PFG8_9BACT|nr:IS66 family insertion sequence element accessory protein TnpB [Candidatus Obscuribacter phosphatis]